jgi:hypothetical protein
MGRLLLQPYETAPDGAIMRVAHQKANGIWSGTIIRVSMAWSLSSSATPKVFAKGHPRFFVREIHKGSSWKFQKPKSLRRKLHPTQNPLPR